MTLQHTSAAAELRALLAELGVLLQGRQRWLIVTAQAGAETAGASWILRRARDLSVLHVIGSAPFEAQRALALAGLGSERLCSLGWSEHQPSLHLPALTRQLRRFIDAFAPAIVVTQPYEGGHPDCDAVACAVRQALRGSSRLLLEMTSCHRWQGAPRIGAFLPNAMRIIERELSEQERATKQAMLRCFASRAAQLGTSCERFRRAPDYDFSRPPHLGPLLYETLSSARWRQPELKAT